MKINRFSVSIAAFETVFQFQKVDAAIKDMKTTSSHMDEILRYTDLAHAVQLARAHDMSDRDIIRALTGSMSYEEARKVAQKAAPLLEMNLKEFMSLRKND